MEGTENGKWVKRVTLVTDRGLIGGGTNRVDL